MYMLCEEKKVLFFEREHCIVIAHVWCLCQESYIICILYWCWTKTTFRRNEIRILTFPILKWERGKLRMYIRNIGLFAVSFTPTAYIHCVTLWQYYSSCKKDVKKVNLFSFWLDKQFEFRALFSSIEKQVKILTYSNFLLWLDKQFEFRALFSSNEKQVKILIYNFLWWLDKQFEFRALFSCNEKQVKIYNFMMIVHFSSARRSTLYCT